MKASSQFEVGMFMWSVYRDTLKQLAFIYPEFEWIESGGLITRVFTAKGCDESMGRLLKWQERNVTKP